MIKTFRGQLAAGGQDHIRLQTIKGKVGYRIVKFELIPRNPSDEDSEAVVKIYKIKQTSTTDKIDFTDNTLLGVGFWTNEAAAHQNPDDVTIIFDSEIFNQDIYITYKDSKTNTGMNYYLELEVIRLTDSDAEFTTLKDIRGRNTTP